MMRDLVANAAGEVTSRQSYDPWGTQLSGPTVEMGYLGAQQRRFDPTSGLIQMGARSYSPTLGRFLTEDPVLGHLGVGTSFNRHAYVWDNPLNLYDLDGLDVCVPTPFGDACAEEAAEDVGNAAGNAAGGLALQQKVPGIGRTRGVSGSVRERRISSRRHSRCFPRRMQRRGVICSAKRLTTIPMWNTVGQCAKKAGVLLIQKSRRRLCLVSIYLSIRFRLSHLS